MRLYQRANKVQEDVERLMMELRESLGVDTKGQPIITLPLQVEAYIFFDLLSNNHDLTTKS